jgi:hypothetical protein
VSANLTSLPRRWLHRLYEYFALWFGLGLLGVISLTWSTLSVPLYYVLPKRWTVPLGRWAITTGFRIYLGALSLIGACRFDLSALDSLRDEGPLVVAPNHPCLLDALMVLSRLPNMACIMKVDIVDNVFLGAGARLAGYIRNDAQLSMIKQAVAERLQGHHRAHRQPGPGADPDRVHRDRFGLPRQGLAAVPSPADADHLSHPPRPPLRSAGKGRNLHRGTGALFHR